MPQMPATNFSIEYFPPRNEEGRNKLDSVHQSLLQLNPEFFSVTYGAGGSTRDGTRRLVLDYLNGGQDVAPHLSFGGSSDAEMSALLDQYKAAGVKRLVALRGDIPSGTGVSSQYRYANEMVAFIRAHSGDHFEINVACYPEMHPASTDFDAELKYFKMKVDAGADAAITQYFYNVDAYLAFRDLCESAGISTPIIPGIMPITNYARLARFSASCGAEIPRWICKRLESYHDDSKSIKSFGEEVVTSLCERLIVAGAPSLHFYSMNQSEAVSKLVTNLSL